VSIEYNFQLNLEYLPLILTGPLLQRTEASQVTVWLALKAARSITLEIYTTVDGRGEIIDGVIANGQTSTIQIGQHLHLAAITAKPTGEKSLVSGKIYAYNLFFGDEREDLLTALQTPNSTGRTSPALEGQGQPLTKKHQISYLDCQLPTFVLPAEDLNHLRLIHGSCRKPHGGGIDSLSCLDDIIAESAHLPFDRPQQLFMTGDQIYGDDVADPFLWLIRGVCDSLIGWDEHLPLIKGSIAASEIPLGNRSNIARIEAGLTAMLDGNDIKAKSHLLSFGEYVAAYLLAWSPVLMPSSFPEGKTIFQDPNLAKQWDKEVREINSFVSDSGKVRRALANIASYTICDDHDISDDWCLNLEWCNRVFSKPLGRKVVQNGLLAYALFQAWGNTPDLFVSGTNGGKLLEATVRWSQSQGTDLVAETEIADYLGIPYLDPATQLPKLQADGEVSVLQRDDRVLPWHYSWHNSLYEIIVVDTRTWRGYPSDTKSTEPPQLLSPSALQEQLAMPLASTKDRSKLTILVLPTNLVTLGAIDLVQQWKLKRNKVFSSDVGDSWNFNHQAMARLLLTLCSQRERVVILSGDIHYSCAVRFDFWFNSPPYSSVLVQLTSSALKNSEWMTRAVHTKIKSLFPESPEYWLGWQQPLHLEKLSSVNWLRNFKRHKFRSPSTTPDWEYRLQWIKRRPSRLYHWQQESTPGDRISWVQKIIVGLSWLCRNRWIQDGTEVIGRNNLSVVSFQQQPMTVVQETYWHPPWNDLAIAKSSYLTSLQPPSIVDR
jgi:hypothetical protein